jgi:hypothetical protein
MKRGWITWDQSELPPPVFEGRLSRVRQVLADRELSALVVYSDVCRSNQARYLTNFMPYWNRALLVVPREDPPILFCSLSPRVYPWIRSVTVLQDIRPSPNLARQLLQLSSEQNWKRIGVWDLPQIPHDISVSVSAGSVELVDLPSSLFYEPALDAWELSMRKRAAKMAREVLTEELAKGVGKLDSEFVGLLERNFRRAGAEDLVILLSNGNAPPSPARGVLLGNDYSVTVAVEYRGHWVRLSRPQTSAKLADSIGNRFDGFLKDFTRQADTTVHVENLSASYPYESSDRVGMGRGCIFALHVESTIDGHRFFYGDTCSHGETGISVL